MDVFRRHEDERGTSYFAGGSPYDISLVHGIGYTDVLRCVWTVVDAVNACPSLRFGYPVDHDEQQKIADGFFKVCQPWNL
jgi:hypothetical protein